MNNKQKLIKTGFFAFATILVLVVATVAWFANGDKAGADPIQSEIKPGKFSAVFYESPDANKDGVQDKDNEGNIIWNEITGDNLDISSMVPGEKHFYKIDITTFTDSISFSLIFKDITTSFPTGYSSADKQNALERIRVHFDNLGGPTPITPLEFPYDNNLYTFFGNTSEPKNITVYNEDLALFTKTSFTIYYNISIDGGKILGGDDILEGTSINIGAIDLSAIINPQQ